MADVLLGDGFRVLPPEAEGAESADDRDAFAQAVRSPAFVQPSLARINAFVRDHVTVLGRVAVLSERKRAGPDFRLPRLVGGLEI